MIELLKRFCIFTMLLLSALAMGLVGCGDADHRPEAIGQEGQITVVMDSAQWDSPLGDAVRENIGAYIETLPAPERSFELQHTALYTPRQFEEVKKRKNLVFIAPLNDSTQEAQFLRNTFSPAAQQAIREGDAAAVSRKDVWRRRQQVFYVTAADAEALTSAFNNGDISIRDTFNLVTRERLYREMFERGRQPDLEERLMEDHGFAVNVQHDYQIAIDTTNFIWLRRVLSDTWRSLFVHYEEGADPGVITPEWIYAKHDSLTQRYLQGSLDGWVEIDRRRPLETKQINFAGRYGFETRGLWHMVGIIDGEKMGLGGGGPFLTYTFYDQPSGRIYMLDGSVFAPGHEKREFLRQMEVIAHTFRTRQDAVQTAQAIGQ